MSKKYHVRDRAFLNKKTDMRAYIIGIVEDTRDIPDCYEDGWKWGHIELKMADCFEEIVFAFDMSSKEERENSLHKIRTMADIVCAVRDALDIEADSIEAREAIKPLLRALSAVH